MNARALLLFLLLAVPGGAVLASAGEVTMLTGRGQAIDGSGLIRDLSLGDAVHSGETLATGPNSFLNLRFADGGLMLLRPNSRLVVEQFRHTVPASAMAEPGTGVAPQQTAGASRAFFRLLKGGLRAVTGAVGRESPDQYRVTTPVATIGIRGTDFMADIIGDVLRGRVTDLIDLLRRLQVPRDTDLGDAVVFGVYAGGIDVTSHGSGQTSPLDPGQYLANFSDGRQFRISEPSYLQREPLPNPESCQ